LLSPARRPGRRAWSPSSPQASSAPSPARRPSGRARPLPLHGGLARRCGPSPSCGLLTARRFTSMDATRPALERGRIWPMAIWPWQRRIWWLRPACGANWDADARADLRLLAPELGKKAGVEGGAVRARRPLPRALPRWPSSCRLPPSPSWRKSRSSDGRARRAGTLTRVVASGDAGARADLCRLLALELENKGGKQQALTAGRGEPSAAGRARLRRPRGKHDWPRQTAMSLGDNNNCLYTSTLWTRGKVGFASPNCNVLLDSVLWVV
jgi:hypothetical protein